MRKRQILCCGLVALMLFGCSSKDSDKKEATSSTETTVEVTTQEVEESTKATNSHQNQKNFEAKLKDFETTYATTNNLPGCLSYIVGGKEIDVHLYNDAYAVMYKLGLGEDIKYTDKGLSKLSYTNGNVEWVIYEDYVSGSPEQYDSLNKTGYACASYVLTAKTKAIDYNNILAGIALNKNVEQVYKIYGVPTKYKYEIRPNVCWLIYENIWLGNTNCTLECKIGEDLKVQMVFLTIKTHYKDNVETKRNEATKVSSEIKDVKRIKTSDYCKDMLDKVINVEFLGKSYDLNKVTFNDMVDTYKDVAQKDADEYREDYKIGNNSYLIKYNGADNWNLTLNADDFKTASVNGINGNSTPEDVIAAFGPYYKETIVDDVLESTRKITYQYITKDGFTRKLEFKYDNRKAQFVEFYYGVSDTRGELAQYPEFDIVLENGNVTEEVVVGYESKKYITIDGMEKEFYAYNSQQATIAGGAVGGRIITYLGSGGTAEWKVNVKSAGEYILWIQYCSGEEREMDVTINGGEKTVLKCASCGNWMDTDKSVGIYLKVNLQEGENSILLSNDDEYAPNPIYIALHKVDGE